MKSGIMVLVFMLSFLVGHGLHGTEIQPEKSIVTKTVIVTDTCRPVCAILRDIKNNLNNVRPLNNLRNKLRVLLGGTKAAPVEQGTENE